MSNTGASGRSLPPETLVSLRLAIGFAGFPAVVRFRYVSDECNTFAALVAEDDVNAWLFATTIQ